jgi:hypothetical protein
MGQDASANGQGINRIAEHVREPEGPRAAARSIAAYDQEVRLCVRAPLHLVERLRIHARGYKKTRDALVVELLDREMRNSYGKRDKALRESLGVPEAAHSRTGSGPEGGSGHAKGEP